MKKKNLYITLLVLLVSGYLISEWARPKPIDWTESYLGTDTIPYGTYIMRDLLPDLFPGEPITYQSEPIFNVDSASEIQNVIFINSQFSPDKFEVDKLLKKVQQGKNVFIAAKKMKGKLADTLNIKISAPSITIPKGFNGQEDSVQFRFSEPSVQEGDRWYYPERLANYYFTSYDTLNSTVLGTVGNEFTNYIKIEKGEGAFYIHSVPYLFTNFYMRDYHKADYVFRALSYLPVAPTAWDNYYKAGRSAAGSPLGYIMSHSYLKWAWITALAGIFLFITFRARRRERVIPEISRPENTTLEFTRTIGRLYHQSGNHKDLAEKKITYFLKYIRDELNLDTHTINDSFITRAAQRSGVNEERTDAVFRKIIELQNRDTLSSKELWELNEKIETFYRESTR